MKLKTIDDAMNITLKEYTEQECREILLERNSFVLKRVRNYGDDYGGSHCSEDTETTYDEIDAESIIVKNGHFAGVAIISEYDYYNGGSDNKLKESLLLIDGGGEGVVRSGFSFSNDDHSRWDYTDTTLVERPE